MPHPPESAPCPTTSGPTSPVRPTSSRWPSGIATAACSAKTSPPCARSSARCARRGPSISRSWWCCPTTCIASGPCRRATLISPPAGGSSRPASRGPSPPASNPHPAGLARASGAFGNAASGSTSSAMTMILRRTWITSLTIRCAMAGPSGRAIGPIPVFTGTSRKDCARQLGGGGRAGLAGTGGGRGKGRRMAGYAALTRPTLA